MPGSYDVEERWRTMWSVLPLNAFLGLQLQDYDQQRGQATIVMPFRDELGNMLDQSGVHGGSLAAFADAVANFALGIKVGSDDTLTTNLRIDYVKWAPPKPVTCRAEVRHAGKRSGLVDVTLSDPDSHVLALGRVSLSHR